MVWRFEAKSLGDLRISIWRFEAKSLGDLRIFKGIRVEKCEVWAKDRVEKCDLRVVGWDYLL